MSSEDHYRVNQRVILRVQDLNFQYDTVNASDFYHRVKDKYIKDAADTMHQKMSETWLEIWEAR